MRSGMRLRCSIFPPTWSSSVRSVVSTTRTSGTDSMALVISDHWSSEPASTVMSRSVSVGSMETRSTEPMLPPASPMAEATWPSIPGRLGISTRMISEYWAEGAAMAGASYDSGAGAAVGVTRSPGPDRRRPLR